MSYSAYITRIKNVRKHPNADRLQLGECFGNTICVDCSYVDSQLGIYFPTDGKLGIEFAEKNNLLRKKDESGNNVGGYMDPDKRNIKAIKLRGEKSDGLFLPLASLETFCTIGDLKEGDKITILNGVTICEKYIPKRNRAQGSVSDGNKTRKKKTPLAPLFVEHADTEQFAYNLGAYRCGDDVEITLKMHGCFMKGTKVRIADNTLKTIESIRPGDYVLGYNFESKKIEPTKVIHTFKNAPSDKWNQLKFSREYIRGDKRGPQTSTFNHKYWVDERQEWVMAQDLQVGDIVSTLFPSPVLTSIQKEVAVGSFLGDGCLLSFHNKVAEIQEAKKKEHIDYLNFISKLTSNWFYICDEKTSGYGSDMIVGRTKRAADLYNYFKNISTFENKDNSRRLLEGIIDKVTPLSLALWYCGDGSLVHSDNQNDRALLAICRYTQKEDRIIIKKIFEKFDIYPTFYSDTKGYWRLRFNLEEANKLFDLICIYIPNCMQYKLPKGYQNKFVMPIETEEYQPNGYVLSSQTVLENISINKMMDEYDLETEFHNYVVGMTIVHNTSQRTAYLPILKGYKRTIWDRLFGCEGTPLYDWGYVSGTRRVVLETDDGGFYGSNAFRTQHSKVFEGKLWKGEEVFYEVVGFTDTGASIMGTVSNKKAGLDKDFSKQYGEETVFSYGCSPDGVKDRVFENGDVEYNCAPQSAMYVYRMTMTNEDGDVVEYTPDFMRYRCDQMGVKTVPVLWRGRIPEHPGSKDDPTISPGEWIKNVAEQFYDGPDPIGKSHVREGVVVRIVNKPKFCAYKHKNFSFKVLEGIIKESAEAPDIEEAQDE